MQLRFSIDANLINLYANEMNLDATQIRHENNSVQFRRQFKWILGSSNYAVQKSRKMIYTVEASLSFSGEFSTQSHTFVILITIILSFACETHQITRWFLNIALMVPQACLRCLRLFSCLIFHQRSYSTKGCLPSKVICHCRQSSIKDQIVLH